MDFTIDLCRVPAVQIPGKVANLDHPQSLAPTILAVLSITTAWGILFTCARFYSNIRKLSWSDYCALISMLVSITILGVTASQLRMARHIWDIPACYFDEQYAIGIWIQGILSILGLFFAKMAIFLLFYQIFSVYTWMRIAVWMGIALNVASHVSAFAVSTVYQIPRPGDTWIENMNTRAGKSMKFFQGHIVFTVAFDVFIFVLPLPAMIKLNISRRQRISLIAVFSLALMGIGASIASLVERFEIMSSPDSTWISAVLNLCGAAELNVAIIVASSVGFASFIRKHLPKLYSGFGSGRPSVDPEAACVEKQKQFGPSPDGTIGSGEKGQIPKMNRGSQYYELNETWMLNTGDSVEAKVTDGELAPAVIRDCGIMRTIAVQREINTKST